MTRLSAGLHHKDMYDPQKCDVGEEYISMWFVAQHRDHCGFSLNHLSLSLRLYDTVHTVSEQNVEGGVGGLLL